MRSTSAVYVDAGYLLAAAATRVTGTSLRNGIHVNHDKLVAAMIEQAESLTALPVLRVHWYDSAPNAVPDKQQERIGEISRVKLRLGRFGVDGQQKGVDLRIGLDLVTHARNRASEVFYLVSGDDDLTEAVEEAQVHGVQVIVLAVPSADGRPQSVSRHLLRAADELVVIDPDVIDASVMKVEVPVLPAPVPEPAPVPVRTAPVRPAGPTPADLAAVARAAPQPASTIAYSSATGQHTQIFPGYDASEYDEKIDEIVDRVIASVRQSSTAADVEALIRSRPSIPRDIDRALLIDLSAALEIENLTDPIRFRLRNRFWDAVEERLS